MKRKFSDLILIPHPSEKDIGVKEIEKLHRSQGMLTCGYHYVVRRDGTVEVGRSLAEPACITLDDDAVNQQSIAVAVVIDGGVKHKQQTAIYELMTAAVVLFPNIKTPPLPGIGSTIEGNVSDG